MRKRGYVTGMKDLLKHCRELVEKAPKRAITIEGKFGGVQYNVQYNPKRDNWTWQIELTLYDVLPASSEILLMEEDNTGILAHGARLEVVLRQAQRYFGSRMHKLRKESLKYHRLVTDRTRDGLTFVR